MGRPAPIKISAALAFLIVALAALTACGAAGSTDGSRAKTAGNRKGGSTIGLKRIGDFESPTYVSGAPGSPRLLFVV
jgi:hypothetical protein